MGATIVFRSMTESSTVLKEGDRVGDAYEVMWQDLFQLGPPLSLEKMMSVSLVKPFASSAAMIFVAVQDGHAVPKVMDFGLTRWS